MKTSAEERELLIEAAAGSHRPLGLAGQVEPHPSWLDLDDAGRLEAYEETRRSRLIEASLDAEGLSTTARAVLRRIRGG